MSKNQTIKSVKGTRDYYPEDMALRTWLYSKMQEASELFGYQEYEAPILESLDLYAAKSGEEIVEKQAYVFTDRSGDRITLRPELTPSLARMIAKKQNQLNFPLRWWSFGPFWRYERPQKGRTREFFQWNIDMIGDDSPEADAEIIAVAATFLKNLDLQADEVQILVNDRRLMDRKIDEIGISTEMKAKSFQWIDRKDKMSTEKWFEYGQNEIGLSETQANQIDALISNSDLWKESPEMVKIFELLDVYGISDYVSFAPHIIRGLLYYTGTVFEAWDTSGEFRALFGGGRYDNLVSDVGGAPVSAVGYAVGDLVLSLLLKKLDRLPNFSASKSPVFIALFSDDLLSETLSLGQKLRAAGINTTNYLKPDKLGKQFKFADRLGAKLVIVMGPDELANNTATIKDLSTRTQEIVSFETLTDKIKEILET